jgi:hypothetical protein
VIPQRVLVPGFGHVGLIPPQDAAAGLAILLTRSKLGVRLPGCSAQGAIQLGVAGLVRRRPLQIRRRQLLVKVEAAELGGPLRVLLGQLRAHHEGPEHVALIEGREVLLGRHRKLFARRSLHLDPGIGADAGGAHRARSGRRDLQEIAPAGIGRRFRGVRRSFSGTFRGTVDVILVCHGGSLRRCVACASRLLEARAGVKASLPGRVR